MPSRALRHWQTRSRKVLDEFETAHALVGGTRAARRFARQQIAQAYVVGVSSHFQRFCRSLYSEAADHLVNLPMYSALSPVLLNSLSVNRRLHFGNATAGNIGADFARFGFRIWDVVIAADGRNVSRRQKLEQMNAWRNAIAHQDFGNSALMGRETVRLSEVRAWRRACAGLTVDFDRHFELHLRSITGVRPW